MASTCTVAQLQKDFAAVSGQVLESREPLFIDQGGIAELALVPADDYLRDMQALSEFKRIFADEGAKSCPQ